MTVPKNSAAPQSYMNWPVLSPCTLVVEDPNGEEVLVRSIDEGYAVALGLNLAGPRMLRMTTTDVQSGATETDNLYFRGRGRNGGMLHHGQVDGAPAIVSESVSDRTLRGEPNQWRNRVLAAFMEELLRGHAHDVRAVVYRGTCIKTIRTVGVPAHRTAHRVVLHLVPTTDDDTV